MSGLLLTDRLISSDEIVVNDCEEETDTLTDQIVEGKKEGVRPESIPGELQTWEIRCSKDLGWTFLLKFSFSWRETSKASNEKG